MEGSALVWMGSKYATVLNAGVGMIVPSIWAILILVTDTAKTMEFARLVGPTTLLDVVVPASGLDLPVRDKNVPSPVKTVELVLWLTVNHSASAILTTKVNTVLY